jgi:hypothetical protein
MSLVDLKLRIDDSAPPHDVSVFLREAERRIERFQLSSRVPGFVPSDFARAYGVLRALAEADLAPGALFCEWGSGFGVVACLASLLHVDAFGIEIEAELVDAARQLAADFDLPVEFIHGSFIPRGADTSADAGDGFSWFTADEGSAHEELGLAPEDFAVIFAYPWPDEERVTRDLFERYAALGAVLVTYHGGPDFRVRRKSSKCSRRVKHGRK